MEDLMAKTKFDEYNNYYLKMEIQELKKRITILENSLAILQNIVTGIDLYFEKEDET